MFRLILFSFLLFTFSCGKVGPLSLPEDQVDKSVITYPCDEACLEKLEEEKKRQQSVVINKVRTGGIEVVVSTSDPKKSALIANEITKIFLESRLENKIKKSDKTLSYLAKKLGEAQVDMDIADKRIEKYILEENLLSAQEFELQTRRLREFRSSIRDLKLPIVGLMCIPPQYEEPSMHFAFLKKIADKNNLIELSMGMSNDFTEAIKFGATSVRIGSLFFGAREI